MFAYASYPIITNSQANRSILDHFLHHTHQQNQHEYCSLLLLLQSVHLVLPSMNLFGSPLLDTPLRELYTCLPRPISWQPFSTYVAISAFLLCCILTFHML